MAPADGINREVAKSKHTVKSGSWENKEKIDSPPAGRVLHMTDQSDEEGVGRPLTKRSWLELCFWSDRKYIFRIDII
jgi:hypothetical protein